MKKMMMVAMALIVACGASFAAPKDNNASAWKYAKKQAKEFAKDGWKVDGIYTLEEAFYNFRVDLKKDPNNREMTGNARGTTTAKTINQGKQWAANNAIITYSKEAGAFLRGRVDAEIGAGVDAASLDNFYDAYEILVQKELQGELHLNFGLFREKKDGTVDYVAYYIVNEDSASKARLRAMENMMKESEFARKHAEEISKFVQEPFQKALAE